MPLEYSFQWHTTKNQKTYNSDICSVTLKTISNKYSNIGRFQICQKSVTNFLIYLSINFECFPKNHLPTWVLSSPFIDTGNWVIRLSAQSAAKHHRAGRSPSVTICNWPFVGKSVPNWKVTFRSGNWPLPPPSTCIEGQIV